MTQHRRATCICFIAFAAILTPVLASAGAASPRPQQTGTRQQALQPVDEGQRVFEKNCSRCHAAPDGFSTRISGTVVRHMRVRASLSERDEKALLKFFNP